MLLYAQKDTLVFIACPSHHNRVDRCLARAEFDGLENGMNLAANHMNHNCFSGLSNAIFKCFEYYSKIIWKKMTGTEIFSLDHEEKCLERSENLLALPKEFQLFL